MKNFIRVLITAFLFYCSSIQAANFPPPQVFGVASVAVTTVAVTPASATPVSSGLSISVIAGATYAFEIFYYVQTSAVANSILTLNFGSATITSIVGMAENVQTGQQSQQPISSYTTTITSTVVAGAQIAQRATGTFVVNAGGTFIPGYATAATSTDSLLAGSWMRITRIN